MVAVGCAIIVELSPDEGLHEYDLFVTDAVPIVVLGVLQLIVLSRPASAMGIIKSAVTIT